MLVAVDVWSSSSRCRQESVYLLRTCCLYTWSCLDILITMRFSTNCSTVICSPTVLFAILREASSETYAPRVYFHHVSFRSTIFHHISFRSTILQSFTFRSINQNYLLYLLFSFIYLYQISLLQVTVKGLTTPLLRWVQVIWLFV